MHEPFRVRPTQRVAADVELPGVIAENHRVAEEIVRLNAAPQSLLGRDLHAAKRAAGRVRSWQFLGIIICLAN